MMKIKKILTSVLFVVAIFTSGLSAAEQNVTVIHLDEYNGYFSAQETLAGLKPGEYEFVVTNKAEKLVGFWLQDNVNHAFLEKTPIEVGQTITTRVTVSENGFRYRCPINPTPWYEVGVN